MRILITGATGQVGRFLVAGLAGHDLIRLGRTGDLPWQLGAECRLPAADALVHCAFDHLPGAYRGGEGEDPAGFWQRNFEGTRLLLEQARAAGVGAFLFLSSRAVYDGAARLDEAAALSPDSLYGRLKWETERMLAAAEGPEFRAIALRATGVCGLPPGAAGHKWMGLFEDFRTGRPIAPRVATEVHGTDLAAAARLLLEGEARGAFNVSDIVLDRHDLLAEVARICGLSRQPPPRDISPVRAMPTGRLLSLGWRPDGWARLRADLPRMLAS